MMKQYEQTFKVRESECDGQACLRLSALWSLLQTVGDENSERLGFGRTSMTEQGVFWALVRMNASLKRYPKFNETIKISTWPAGLHKMLAFREYCVFDAEGNELANATSAWVVVDFRTGRPQRPVSLLSEDSIFAYGFKGNIPEKLPGLSAAKYVRDFFAEFSDIDLNQHVNNSRYINWMENMIVPDLGEERIREICVNYIQETKMGDKLEGFRQLVGGEILTEFRNEENKAVFRAKLGLV